MWDPSLWDIKSRKYERVRVAGQAPGAGESPAAALEGSRDGKQEEAGNCKRKRSSKGQEGN